MMLIARFSIDLEQLHGSMWPTICRRPVLARRDPVGARGERVPAPDSPDEAPHLLHLVRGGSKLGL